MKTTLGRRWLSLFLTLVMCLTLSPSVWAADGDTITSITLSKTALTLVQREEALLTVTDSSDNEVTNVTWTSGNDRVATVDKGVVTGVAAGTTTITATVGTLTAQCTVTVNTRMGRLELQPSGPITMDPGTSQQITAVPDPDNAEVSWTYRAIRGAEDAVQVNPRGKVVRLSAVYPGEGKIVATITGEGADNNTTTELEVTVSGLVLSDEDKTMSLIESETQILPNPDRYGTALTGGEIRWQSADPNVAQISNGSVAGRGPGSTTITGSIGGKYQVSFTVTVTANEETTITHTMKTSDRLEFNELIDKFDKQAEGGLSHVTGLFVEPAQGTLFYKYRSPDEPNAGVAQRENYYYAPAAGQNDLSQITFIPNPAFSGSQVNIGYTVISRTNQASSGRIIISMQRDQATVIDLSATNTSPAWFSGNLFDRQCQQQTGSGLDYVIFSIPPKSRGVLYAGYVSANNYGSEVTAGTMYSLAQLDDIVFVPAPGAIPAAGRSNTVTVYYTARSKGSSGTYNGQVNIRVTRDNTAGSSSVLYNIAKGATKTFDDGDFVSFTGQDLSFLRFDSLPASQEGVLYYGYRSASSPGTRVQTDTSYYAGTRTPRLDRITFVPAQDFTGNIKIPFTGWDIDGNRFIGELEINVERGGGSGDIRYTCVPGRTVNFVLQDFVDLSRDLTGIGLNYIVFQDLPDRSAEGSIYHNSSRVGSTSTRYYNGSSSNRIRDLSFRAVSGLRDTVEIPFIGYTASSGVTFNGVITIDPTGSGSTGDTTIHYYTESDTAAVFDRDDFDETALDETGYKVSSVKFSVPASSRGDLYRNYRSSSSKGTRISSSSTSISASSLDSVAFVPAKDYTGTVYIDYTITTTNSKETVEGTVEIEVERPGAAVTVSYSTRTAPVDFNGSDFRRSGYTLRSIKFSSLPSSSEGTLYYQYTGPNQYTRLASTSTTYNLSGSNLISDLTFVPRDGFSGTVVLPYTGTNSNSSTFYGEVVITVTPYTSSTNRFNDLGGYSDQQRAAVAFIYDRGITNGISTTQYGPERPIRRGDFARMVYIAFGFTPGSSSWVFNDVLPDKYYAQAVNTLYDRGIVSGVGNGDYSPESSVSRQDAVCMIQRAMRSMGWNAYDGPYSALSGYYDAGSVSGYAQGAMAMAVQRGYLPFAGSYLSPRQPLTRMEMAEILYRILNA